MPTKLFLAPAASGKTAHMLELARQRANSLQAEVRVCVPTALQARAWRQRLAEAGGAIGVRVLTFDQLAATCLNAAGEAYTELSKPVRHRLLRMITGQLPLEHYAPLKTKPGFIQVANQVITELKSGLVDPLKFSQAVVELGDEPRLRELAAIYTAYQKQLHDKEWADRVGLQWLAVEALKERAAEACRDWPLLIVDGFDDLTPSQLALLQLLAGRVDEFFITLPQADPVDYPRYQSTQQEIEEALGVEGEQLQPLVQGSGHPALRHLARNIFALSAVEPVAADGAFTLREAPDRTAEVRTALRWLKQRIVWEKIPLDQAALLARDIMPYRSHIQQIAAEFGLPIRLVDGVPLRQSPVVAALLELLRLYLPIENGGEPVLPRRQLISAWRSPYFSWGQGELSINAEDADVLDILAREQRVIRGLAQWKAAFAAGRAAGDHELDDEQESGIRVLTRTAVKQLQLKFDYFQDASQPPTGAASMRAFAGWLETLIGPDPQAGSGPSPDAGSLQITARAHANPETAEADVAALCTLKDILRGLVWAEEAVEQTDQVDFISFFNELSGAIAATQFTLPERAEQPELLVTNVFNVRGLSFEAAAVMGLSEGAFPATISEDPFLRDVDRERLSREFGFQLEPSTQSAEREFFYEAITRPRQKLLLTRPVLAENGAEWVASPFWEAARRLMIKEVEQIGGETLLPLAETASWAEWWETFASDPDDAQGAQREDPSTWQQIKTAAEVWQARVAAEPSIWEGDLGSLAPALTAQHGPHTVWSASRLESYQTCGFLFFLQYILRLAPRPEPAEGLDARQLGSLYHNIFEQVTRTGGLDPADEGKVQEVVTAVATPILDAAPEKEGFRETPWWAHTRQEIIENVTQSLLLLAAGDFDFYQAELSFGFRGPPLVIEDGEDKLKMRGFIDRVDRAADGQVRIIDYKLGGPYRFTKRAFAEGKKLQLPLYALAAQEVQRVGPVADGFYWHYRQGESSSFQLAKAEGGVAGAIETAVAYAWQAVRQIRDGQFTPIPPDGGCPAYCPAAGFCWQYSPSSW